MSIKEIFEGGAGVLFAILTLVQISPIKVNPWSTFARIIGKALNADVIEAIHENEARQSRYRILRFDDEIRHHERHTQEHFDQILEDIDTYERYCREHPKFPNNKATSAVSKIKKTYETCREENSFLV